MLIRNQYQKHGVREIERESNEDDSNDSDKSTSKHGKKKTKNN